jgi:hypothetical protein
MADGAFWYSSQTGEFISSTYYFDDLPKWVKDFNDGRRAAAQCGKKWERLRPAADYERRAGRDDAPWEKGDGKSPYVPPVAGKNLYEFPHVVPDKPDAPSAACYDGITYTPFSNDLLVEFAKAAITNPDAPLGDDSDTDVLTVSFSANDIVGHRFGPYSQELMDMTLRVDRQIGELLDFVDARVGRGNTVVVFTADHGVAPSPEHAFAMHLPGERVMASKVMTTVCERVRAHFKKPGTCENKPGGLTADYGLTFSNGQIYFDAKTLERDNVRAEEMEHVVGEAALSVPGVARYFTRTQLLNNEVSTADAVARRVLHGYNARRSGDVVLVAEPFKYLADYVTVATHGAPYSYDTHVPLIIMGGGVVRGLYRTPATPADIAPTLAALLGVQPPSSAVGRALIEALR